MRSAAVVLIAFVLAFVAGCRQGHRPETAAVPVGPSSGTVGAEYMFSSCATDPDGDDVAIRFDWGDGDTSDWSSWVRPGDTVTMSYAWTAPGTFNAKAQAKARNFTISGWSDAHSLVVASGWFRSFGGAGDDSALSVQQTSDGGYIITGCTDSTYGERPRLMMTRVGANGDLLWSRVFGDGVFGWGRSVLQARDGGFVVVGCKYLDVWIIKTDAEGNMVWEKTYGGPDWDEGYSVQQTKDGGYIVSGTLREGLLLLKADTNGDVEWAKVLVRGWCEGRSVQQTQDGGYVIAAMDCNEGFPNNLLLIKTDASGDTLWSRACGGSLPYYPGMSVQQTDDGGYVACCTRWNSNRETDAALVRTDSTGQLLWVKNYGGGREDWGNSLAKTLDGGFVIAGNTANNGTTGFDVWLIKTDADGDTLWTRTYGGIDNDMGYSVQATSDGGYVIAGKTWSEGLRSQVLLIKTDAEGNVDEGQGKDEFRIQKSETRNQSGVVRRVLRPRP